MSKKKPDSTPAQPRDNLSVDALIQQKHDTLSRARANFFDLSDYLTERKTRNEKVLEKLLAEDRDYKIAEHHMSAELIRAHQANESAEHAARGRPGEHEYEAQKVAAEEMALAQEVNNLIIRKADALSDGISTLSG